MHRKNNLSKEKPPKALPPPPPPASFSSLVPLPPDLLPALPPPVFPEACHVPLLLRPLARAHVNQHSLHQWFDADGPKC